MMMQMQNMLQYSVTIILGVDPGLHRTGLGVVQFSDNKYIYIAHDLIKTKPSAFLETRLKQLFESMSQIIQEYKPDIVIVEEIFASVNRNTIIKLGMARAIPVLCAAQHNCKVINIPTRIVKKHITGYGAAEKEQIAQSVCNLLNIEYINNLDATDALACALCYDYSN